MYSICIQIRIPNKSNVKAKAGVKILSLNILVGLMCGSSAGAMAGNEVSASSCYKSPQTPSTHQSTDNEQGLKDNHIEIQIFVYPFINGIHDVLQI